MHFYSENMVRKKNHERIPPATLTVNFPAQQQLSPCLNHACVLHYFLLTFQTHKMRK